jgi:hypothetical protein
VVHRRQEYFSELFDPDLAVERAKTMEDLRKARRIAYAFRFICPSYYIPGEQDWGRSDCKEVLIRFAISTKPVAGSVG